MQTEELQRLQEELQAVRESLEPLREKQFEELMKDDLDETKLDQLHEAIAPLAAEELQLLRQRMLLSKGEQ